MVVVFLLVNYAFNFFYGKDTQQTITSDSVTIETTSKEYKQNDLVTVKISNKTANSYTIKDECPNEPFEVLYHNKDKQWTEKTSTPDIKCDIQSGLTIKAGEEKTIDYKSWNHALFSNLGKYKIRATLILDTTSTSNENSQQVTQQTVPDDSTVQTKILETPEFEIKPEGWFGMVWTAGFYQPIYNILIFIVSVIPFHDLGFAILILTIIIRTILLVPSQKALKSQRKMNELQPKLAKIKEKYKDNQEEIAKETMALWKEHKVNPMGSCLPLLIQFPILIALFYVIQDGLNPDKAYLLYEPLKTFSINSINVNFLGILDLTKFNTFLLPLFVGILQFLQMKLALVSKKEDKQQEKKKEATEMETAGKAMMYFMPVMIAMFTASVPAGVGLYWSISTTYGIIQQIVVNRQVEAEKVKIRVLPPEKA